MSEIASYFADLARTKSEHHSLVYEPNPQTIGQKVGTIAGQDLRRALDALPRATNDGSQNLIELNERRRLTGLLSLHIWENIDQPTEINRGDRGELESNILAWLLSIYRDDSKGYFARYRCADQYCKDASAGSVREQEMRAMLFVPPDDRAPKELFKFYADHPETLLRLHNWFLQHYAFDSARDIRRAANNRERAAKTRADDRADPAGKPQAKRTAKISIADGVHSMLPRVQAATLIGLLPLLTTNEAWSVLWSLAPWQLLIGGLAGSAGFLALVAYETAKQLDDFPASKRPLGFRMWGIVWRSCCGALGMTGLTWLMRGNNWDFAPAAFGLAGVGAFLVSAIFALFVGYVLTLFLEDKSLADPF